MLLGCWVTEKGRVAEKAIYKQIFNFLAPFIYSISCANRAQLATAWSTRDTCTVCGHPTMSNYFTTYSYKIVGVAVLVFAYCSGYHCYSYYLSNYKLGVHMYCLWPPHYYTWGVHMYCLWPPHYYTWVLLH